MKKMYLMLLLFILFGCNEKEPTHAPNNSLKQSYERTRDAFYGLGRSSGILAYQTLLLRKHNTGKEFTLEEVYALADSASEIKTRYNY